MSKPTYYEYFGLPNFEEDQDKIKRAYRSMALKHHPDRGGSLEDMKSVNEVFRVLSKHKQEYDHHLRRKLGIVSPVYSEKDLDAMIEEFRKSYNSSTVKFYWNKQY